ncbi:MAG: FAD-dependent monooxygenase, partial [Pseudomonadota bacterium]
MSDYSEFDVIVVGLGPTGATLANLLIKTGVRVLVLEREPSIYNLPRAVHFDDETMRVFQTAGIAEALSEKIRVNPGMRFVDPQGKIVLD